MEIHITRKAAQSWAAQLRMCEGNFGHRIVLKAIDDFEKKLSRLLKHPELGHPEPLLAGRKEGFRALLLSRNTKAIYYVREDVIEVVDIWDMRMNPDKLAKRL